jgi:RNA polymerase sigma factor (sigma-70 family)
MKTVSYFNTDARMLDELRKGEEKPLAELFRLNRRAIYSLVTQNNGTEDDAEDVLQESLIILWEQIRKGTFVYQAKLSTYLYGTAKHLWFRRLYRKKREIPLPEEFDGSDESDIPLEAMETEEETQAVAAAMAQIGSPCKELLLMFYWEERSMEEIAVALHFSGADTAKSKKYQCKKSLEVLVKKQLREVRR